MHLSLQTLRWFKWRFSFLYLKAVFSLLYESITFFSLFTFFFNLTCLFMYGIPQLSALLNLSICHSPFLTFMCIMKPLKLNSETPESGSVPFSCLGKPRGRHPRLTHPTTKSSKNLFPFPFQRPQDKCAPLGLVTTRTSLFNLDW